MIDFVKQIAQGAGKLILQSSIKVVRQKKGGGNITLQADMTSELYLMKMIKETYPQDVILSEESFESIPYPDQQKRLWIIDPLDGSTNRKNNIPTFGVSIAFVTEGNVQIGVIYDPNRKELFWAEKGKGAYLNGQKISVLAKRKKENYLCLFRNPMQITYQET